MNRSSGGTSVLIHSGKPAERANPETTYVRDYDGCLSGPSFWKPQYLEKSAWLEHAPFAFWITSVLKPRSIVELGTHTGFSYFAFCQAVQANGMETRCFAIDTWKGDEHAGFYGDDVFDRVNRYNNLHYSAFSSLVRSTFDQALQHFADSSVDLLHVDGRHHYHDVKNDFESWVPKLSERSVVLFHDTNVRERGFGVFQFWAELAESFPNFEFFHGHGLGVLGYGANIPANVVTLFANSTRRDSAVAIRAAYSRLGGSVRSDIEACVAAENLARSTAAANNLKFELENHANEIARLGNEWKVLNDKNAALKLESKRRSEQLEVDLRLQTRQCAAAEGQILERDAEIKKLKQEIAESERRNQRSEHDNTLALNDKQRQLFELQLELNMVLRSRSWRSTAPLRRIMTYWSGRRSRGRSATRFLRIFREVILRSGTLRLNASSLFDSEYYLATYPDVRAYKFGPATHYLIHGWREHRNPSRSFNTADYLSTNPDVAAAGVNPLIHYLKHGRKEGRHLANGIRSSFDAAFVAPFYEASGMSNDPLDVWRHLSAIGAIPPATSKEAKAAAAAVRQSPFFNAEFYRRRLPDGMDPALHYAVIGEKLGWAPSESFDPHFYLARHPDLKSTNISLLMHYQNHGKVEGRRGLPRAKSLSFARLADERRPILVICHEASRTGAPILGWNLIRELRKKHQVITLLMGGGVLEKEFLADSHVLVGPLTDGDWHPAELAAIAERLVQTYRPLYAIANSIVTSPMIPHLGALGVPSVSLVHEFASYTRPHERMRSAYDWAMHIVFPAQVVAESSFESFPGLESRPGIHVLAQGRQFLPAADSAVGIADESSISDVMRTVDEAEKFIVLGAGYVQLRKGVDLFLSVAALARRLAPDVPFQFIWVGEGYKPDEDVGYSVYLREQIKKSNLEDSVVFLEAVADFEPAYRTADVFLMSSRLDPQPNVGIDAVSLGLPLVCFAKACGTAEILANDPETMPLVVPYLDVDAAARVICRLANDPAWGKAMSRAVERVGRSAFNGEAYVEQIASWGSTAAAALSPSNLEILRASGTIDSDMALPPFSRMTLPNSASIEQIVLLQSIVNMNADLAIDKNVYFRRAIPGFHPQAYALAHIEECSPGGESPIVHWLRHGQVQGPWSHKVYSPRNVPNSPSNAPRVALHAHFHYTEFAPELMERLRSNQTACDLFISTDLESKAEALRRVFIEHHGLVEIRVMPNLGRDIAPLLTGFSEVIGAGEYDIWGHVHGKKSAWLSEAGIGNAWRTFLWENLIGGTYPMLDIAVAAFAADPELGLIFAEDPHLVGWDKNRKNAEALAERMGISQQLPVFFDFPIGTMFWFRPAALRRLFALELKWNDYPKEPVPYDGSLLHAIERIIPFVVEADAYRVAGVRAPLSNW